MASPAGCGSANRRPCFPESFRYAASKLTTVNPPHDLDRLPEPPQVEQGDAKTPARRGQVPSLTALAGRVTITRKDVPSRAAERVDRIAAHAQREAGCSSSGT